LYCTMHNCSILGLKQSTVCCSSELLAKKKEKLLNCDNHVGVPYYLLSELFLVLLLPTSLEP
jgi:hypothetical protein